MTIGECKTPQQFYQERICAMVRECEDMKVLYFLYGFIAKMLPDKEEPEDQEVTA